jgi:uncharacterized protein YodC (DUF2158 family)
MLQLRCDVTVTARRYVFRTSSKESEMMFQPGDIVALKSGGQSMTVSAVSDENVECIWIGEEGDFFRETVPAAVLKAAEAADVEDESDEDDADDADDEDEQESGEEVRKIA